MTDEKILIQFRVPKKVYLEVRKAAIGTGTTVATWVRQIIMREVGVDGYGKKIENNKETK